jgi:hypothetical protein
VEAPVRVERVSIAEAVQITEENIEDVAIWSGGVPCGLYLGSELNRIAIGNPAQRYTVGDWIVHEDGRFFGVTAAAFAVLYRDAS